MPEYALQWSPAVAQQINDLNAILILPPREMSKRRLIQLVKHYLPKSNLILGIATEPYVSGFENQPQFRTLQQKDIGDLVERVNAASKRNKLYTLSCPQTDLATIAQLTEPRRVLMVNGSWQYVVHRSEVYTVLEAKKVPVKFVSPFVDEEEARQYEMNLRDALPNVSPGLVFSEQAVPDLLAKLAARSYDHSFQTSTIIAKKKGTGYELVMRAHNRVIPYETYALHHGSQREIHKSALHDAVHYDTIHAEMDMLVQAQKQKVDLAGMTLFINLLPCPNCARTLSQTDIAEFVYQTDHSEGYAVKVLRLAGKVVRRAAVN